MISHELDSTIVLSRAVAAQGIRPAVDILASKSSLLTPEVVGERHYELATRATAILQKYESLKGIIAIIGESELSAEDRDDYNKAKALIEFFKQRFNVMFKVTGVEGEHMTREQTLDGVEAIIGKSKEPIGGSADAPKPENAPATAPTPDQAEVAKPTDDPTAAPSEAPTPEHEAK
jgi:F0F1-type ATP synthase beta subunit